MRRRSFLKAVVALPFVGGFLKGWTPAEATAIEEEYAPVLLSDRLLAVALGDPLSITVVVPEGRPIKVTGYMHVVSVHGHAAPAVVTIQEAGSKATLAMVQQVMDDHYGLRDLRTEVVLTPTPGCHTYKLTASRGVVHEPLLSSIKAEVWP